MENDAKTIDRLNTEKSQILGQIVELRAKITSLEGQVGKNIRNQGLSSQCYVVWSLSKGDILHFSFKKWRWMSHFRMQAKECNHDLFSDKIQLIRFTCSLNFFTLQISKIWGIIFYCLTTNKIKIINFTKWYILNVILTMRISDMYGTN